MKATVTAKLKTPVNFPWENGVSVNITLDGSNKFEDFLQGMKEIKAMINKDCNKHGIPFSVLDITIDL